MLERYKIIKRNNEEILYLYLNMNYEFSKELTTKEYEKKANNYLSTYNIKFNGNKVIFVINGIESKEINLNSNKLYLNNKIINLSTNEKLTLKELILSLLFSNIHIVLNEETIKAITVLYRSEIINNLENNNLDIKKLSLLYHNYNYYKLYYIETFNSYLTKFSKAIDETDSEYLVYNDKPINCYTHLVSNGYTEEDKEIPYLAKKESLWDLTYPNYMQIKTYGIEEFKNKLDIKDNNLNIKINTITESNRIKEIIINNKIIDSKYLSILLDLPSTDITIITKNNYISLITRGIGSGKGLSIIGANNLAELNCNYKQILNYYFKDIKLITKKA